MNYLEDRVDVRKPLVREIFGICLFNSQTSIGGEFVCR
jgi:hypothetical protein